MPAFAPRSAVVASLKRGQDARDAHYIGTVIIAGVPYTCEVHLAAVAPETEAESGAVLLVQRGRAVILKTLMLAPPRRDSVIRVGEVDYIVTDVGGHDAHEPAWVIPFHRLPPKPRHV